MSPDIEITGKRILVADGDQLSLRMFSKALSERGYDVNIARNNTETLQEVQIAKPYDAILISSLLPTSGGIDACNQIRSLPGAKGYTPIIAVTISDDVWNAEHYLNAGFDDCISKDEGIEGIFSKVANLIRRTHGRGGNELLGGGAEKYPKHQ